MYEIEVSAQDIPRHIAIIMDGNGRWAKARKLPRHRGHMEGVIRVEEIIEEARDLGVKVLTLYTFSTENWLRPKDEIKILMKTLCNALEKKCGKMMKGNIRFMWIGEEEGVPEDVSSSLNRVKETTKDNTGMVLNLAFNYGSRLEILRSVQRIIDKVEQGQIEADQITEETISQHLYTQGLPDPDLLIRTSGEERISNFLLWQLSYSELYFTDIYWPDFTKVEFQKAIKDFQQRERRYGNIGK